MATTARTSQRREIGASVEPPEPLCEATARSCSLVIVGTPLLPSGQLEPLDSYARGSSALAVKAGDRRQ